jgi:hypothetical protein
VVQNVETPVGSSGFPAPTTTNPCAVPAPITAPTATSVDPCAQRKAIIAAATNTVVAALNQSIATSGNNGAIEYGANLNLTNWQSSTPTYMSTTVTPGGGSNWSPTFSWDANSGYNIGSSHWHPGGTGPSPDDVFTMIANLTNTNNTSTNKLIASGANAIKFYKSNVSVTVETSTTNYVVTVNNWGSLQTLYTEYQNSYNATTHDYGFDQDFINAAASHSNSYTYALLSIFGDAINLYTAPAGSTTYTPVAINTTNSTVSTVTCP